MGQQIEEETAGKASRAKSDPDSSSESEPDDTVLDKDYRPEEDDCPDNGSDTDTALHSEGETGAALETSAVQCHRSPTPHMWKREVIKEKCLKGDKNTKGQERSPKTMGPPCTSQHCLRSKKRSCELLTEEQRTDIFKNFWSVPSWETLVENVPVKQKKVGVASRRTTSLSYHLQLGDRCKLPVCKNLFCSTLGICSTIGSWLTVDMKTKTDPCKPKINKTGPHVPIMLTRSERMTLWTAYCPLPLLPSGSLLSG